MHPYFKQALEKFLDKKTRSNNEVVRLLDERTCFAGYRAAPSPSQPPTGSFLWVAGRGKRS